MNPALRRTAAVLATEAVAATIAAGAASAHATTVTDVCTGVQGCRVVARADINGDGTRDVVGLARRGGGTGSRGALIVRVQTAPQHVTSVRRPLETWAGSAWLDVAALDGRRGKEIVIGRLMGASAAFYQSLTWRHGTLVLLDAPGPDRWWGVGRSATVIGGWLKRAQDPRGTIHHRVATAGSTPTSPYRGRITTYRWTPGGWTRVHVRTVRPLSPDRARTWGGFHVPGLARW